MSLVEKIDYLLKRRVIIFFDEWLTYVLLIFLWYNNAHFLIIGGCSVLAICFNGYAYFCFFELEERIHEHLLK